MLKKLFKYDFKSFGRILLPLYAAVIVIAVISAISFRPMVNYSMGAYISSDNSIRSFSVIILLLYFFLFCGTGIMSIILSITRFKNNLLGKEGYLTNVLPVSPSKQIISKTLSATLWQIITGVVAGISGVLFIFVLLGSTEFFAEFGSLFRDLMSLLSKLDSGDMINIGLFILDMFETLILGVICLIGANLMFYASLVVGHTANSKKITASFGAFIGFYVISQIINLSLLNWALPTIRLSRLGNSFYRVYIIPVIILYAAYAAGYFFITKYFLTKKLNLE